MSRSGCCTFEIFKFTVLLSISFFKQAGFKNLFLWTDEECNVDWYINHNYELVNEDIYELFSSEEDYKTYVFKMKLE